MQYEIFMEVVFLQYTVLTTCVLLTAAAFRGLRIWGYRLLFGALCGGILGCIGLVISIRLHSLVLCAFFVGMVFLLSAVAFPIISRKNYKKNSFAVLVSIFMVGGISIVMNQRLHILKHVFFFAFVMLAAALLTAYTVRKIKVKRCQIYPVTLYWNGEVKSVRALADSGNRIADAQGKSVCVCSQDILASDFSVATMYCIRTLGKETQQMKGGILEKMIVHTREGNFVYQNVPAAIYPGHVSASGEFEMILHTNYCIRE